MSALEIAALAAAGSYLAFLGVEAVLLRRARAALRVVVHVNGTRGKTETTRIIAAALRTGGIRTLAKTTGTEPRLLLEDGSERRWRRLGAANVREQRDVLRLAARRRAEALVVECMAVSPDAQVASTAFLRPSILVVTNARCDHEAELGTPEEALAVFAQGIPDRGLVVTADPSILAPLQAVAAPRGADTVLAEQLEVPWAHPDNVGAALAIAERLGIARDVALAGMAGHTPDPGACALRRLRRPEGGSVVVLDALAANDPQSADEILRRSGLMPRILLLANRSDRPDRALRFARWAANANRWQTILLAGEPVPGLRRLLGGHDDLRELDRLEDLTALSDGALVFATGNWRTFGPRLAAASTPHREAVQP